VGFTDLDQCPCGSSLGMIREVCEYGMWGRRLSVTASAAAGKKTFGGGCSGQARLSGVPVGVVPVACTKWSDGVGEEVGDGAMGSGTATGVRDNDGDTTGGIKAEGGVRDGVGDGNDAVLREAVASREVAVAPR
jgi:hypothetical protein